jgi:hypothetical protein
VTESGKPITANDGENTLITTYDSTHDEFINGANRTLGIFINSQLDKHYLKDGGKYVTAIGLEREIFSINFRPNNNTEKLIYCYREERKKA